MQKRHYAGERREEKFTTAFAFYHIHSCFDSLKG